MTIWDIQLKQNRKSYNVITQYILMVKAFQAKIRHLGNSKGIIIPKEVINEMDLEVGDTVTFKVPEKDLSSRNETIRSMAGSYKDKMPFEREKEDRY